ncbi:perilipin-4 [Trichechus manatus latirostris]|uniref:Perilipin n=1 Tax=Trichechus manatus latirostris TaxID=127582 RepID=A0A2Y9DPU2_TRIMA|nr:perilipin-4 [Trichechus manatus latirostris]
MTRSKDAYSSGVTNVVDAAKGVVQGGMGMGQSELSSAKEVVTSGVTGALGVAKGVVQGGLDTSKSVVMSTKDTMATGITGAVNVAKGAVQTGVDTTKTMLTGTKDAVCSGVTGAANVAKGAVQTGLDTTKTVLTGTKDTVSSGVTGATNVVKGTIQTGLDTTKTVLTGTKDTVCSGVTGAANMAKGAVQGGLDTTKLVLTGTKDTVSAGVTGAANVAKGAVQTGLDTTKTQGETRGGGYRTVSRELGEIFQPMSMEEQAQLAASEPGPKVLSADQGSYFIRLGDLAPGFRQRAFEHTLSHLQDSQFQAREAMDQLQDSFRLIEKGNQPGPDQGSSIGAAGTSNREVDDTEVLSRVRGLLRQLHVAYSGLALGLQSLPSESQQQAARARHSLCELYGVVSVAGSLSELPAESLAQSFKGVSQAWQGLEQLLVQVQHSPPLGWLVGPFVLPPGAQQL